MRGMMQRWQSDGWSVGLALVGQAGIKTLYLVIDISSKSISFSLNNVI